MAKQELLSGNQSPSATQPGGSRLLQSGASSQCHQHNPTVSFVVIEAA